MKKPDDLLYESRTVIGELLGKAWELCGGATPEAEFEGWDWVKSARKIYTDINLHLSKQIRDKEIDQMLKIGFEEFMKHEKRHWEESGKPPIHLYHYFLKLQENNAIIEGTEEES